MFGIPCPSLIASEHFVVEATLLPGCWVMPNTAATTSGTAVGSLTAANSKSQTPSGNSSASCAATAGSARPVPARVNKVFVVGYPAILPEDPADYILCRPVLPVATGDIPYLRDQVEKLLNRTIRNRAVAHGAVYVDTYTRSIGHDACQAPTIRWVEPVAPAADAAPVHPNRLGMEATAAAVRSAM